MRSGKVFRCAIMIFFVGSLGVNLVWGEETFCAVGWHGEFTHISPTLGEMEPTRTDLPVRLQALAWSRDGTLYAGTGRGGGLFTLDPYTGNTELAVNVSTDIRGMAFSPSNDLYVTASVNSRQQNLRILDMDTGNYSDLGALWGDNTASQGLAFSPDGTLYGITANKIRVHELYTIDLDDCEMHLIGSYLMPVDVSQSLTFTPDGSLYAVGDGVFAQLNPDTGAVIGTPISLDGDYRGLAVIREPVMPINLDIKPQSCPNPFNVNSKGVLPVAILGTEEFDVSTIVSTSVRLAGVEPIRNSLEDVAAPLVDPNECECSTNGPDGFTDLTLKFETQAVLEALGEVNTGDILTLRLTGVLDDETSIEGADCVVIVGRFKPINKADINKDGVVNTVDIAMVAENWFNSSIVDD